MNGKKGSISIDIPLPPERVKKPVDGSSTKWIWDVWDFAMEDTTRVTYSLKVGLAVVLVSLLILIRPTYHVLGNSIIWAILTVAIMFEYTVGATFNRGFNRALGSLLAGIFAIVVIQIAMSCGQVAEPYIIGFSIFLIGGITTFMKLWPSLVPYEYGFRVSLFTYCMIITSGYRIGDPIKTAIERLYAVAIGAVVAFIVNVLILPVWAGEKLHKELVNGFNSVAESLEECVMKYLSDDGSERPEFTKKVIDDFTDEPAFRKCRATLNSSEKLNTLASSAKWEPPHGKFRGIFYPWSEYVKVGVVLRHCAFEVMALHGCLHSEIQVYGLILHFDLDILSIRVDFVDVGAPYNLRCVFQSEIMDATNEAAELVRSLGKDISNMKHNLQIGLLKRVHSSTERLQRSIVLHSYLLTLSHELYNSSAKPLVKLSKAHSFAPQDLSHSPANSDEPEALNVEADEAESYQEMRNKQLRRLHSWPKREVDEYDDQGVEADLVTKMRALESTAALSFATFISLLIEFVARLDHLVDAVDELAKMASFKEYV